MSWFKKKGFFTPLLLAALFVLLGANGATAGAPDQGESPENALHTVRAGETMWLIANHYNISLESLIAANPDVTPTLIYPEQKIKLPAGTNAERLLAAREGRSSTSRWNFSPAEIDLFARLVHSEAAGEPYTGLVAVAASVLNRLQSSIYPNTLSGVIYQVVGGYYQYSPVLDGRINLPACQNSYRAVYEAMAGADPSGGALGFYNPRKTSNQWVRRQPVTRVIGNHVFFR